MESTELNWEAYGDVNPIEHGGVWALNQKDRDNAFFLVELVNMEEACGEPGFLISSCYVDLEDSWIEMDRVKSFIGADEDTSAITLAIGVLAYYGPEHCGGEAIYTQTEEGAIAEVESHGIDL